MPQVFQYGFNYQNFGSVVTLIIVSILGFSVYSYLFKKKEIKINLHNLLSRTPLLILYALFFAIPEEVIFRGVIQSYLQTQLHDTVIAVVLASVIFGIVHLPNGAEGINPRKWNWHFTGIAFLGGLVFGEIFALTDSLLISTLLHTFFLFLLIFKAIRK
jgi:hypothetical protein